jgi:hypothetical protein
MGKKITLTGSPVAHGGLGAPTTDREWGLGENPLRTRRWLTNYQLPTTNYQNFYESSLLARCK